MRELFVATSYHHVLTAIAKKYENKSSMDLLISNLITGDEYWFKYLDKLKSSGLLDNIYYYDGKRFPHPKPYNIIKTYYYEFFGEKKIIKSIPGFDPLKYDLIYLIEDKAFPSSTIIRNNRPYHYCEDAPYFFSRLVEGKTLKVLRFPYFKLKKFFEIINYWHPIFGTAECCIGIETSTFDNIPEFLSKSKLILVDRRRSIDNLSRDIKDKILDIFLDKNTIKQLVDNMDSTAFLMTSIYKSKVNYDEQRLICKLAADRFKGKYIVIKPHPRDETNYDKVVDNSIVLSRHFPTEILNFVDELCFDTAISVKTSASRHVGFARNIVNYSLEDLGFKFDFYG